jgi:hypothetical protein
LRPDRKRGLSGEYRQGSVIAGSAATIDPMEPEARADLDLAQLRAQWLRRLDDTVGSGRFAPGELEELARRYRALAEATASNGQQRAARELAERFQRAARERVASNG